MALNYSKWDDLYDSDEEKKKAKIAEENKRKAEYRKSMNQKQKPPPMPGNMTEQQFADQYAKMVNGNKQRTARRRPARRTAPACACQRSVLARRSPTSFLRPWRSSGPSATRRRS